MHSGITEDPAMRLSATDPTEISRLQAAGTFLRACGLLWTFRKNRFLTIVDILEMALPGPRPTDADVDAVLAAGCASAEESLRNIRLRKAGGCPGQQAGNRPWDGW
jgi:hypothetical protein